MPRASSIIDCDPDIIRRTSVGVRDDQKHVFKTGGMTPLSGAQRRRKKERALAVIQPFSILAEIGKAH